MKTTYISVVIIILSALGFYFWASNDKSISEPREIYTQQKVFPAPLYLKKLREPEKEYWLEDNIHRPPTPPKLIVEDIGIKQPFCIALEFTISSQGAVVAWEISKVYPESVANELSDDDFSDIRYWKFKPALNNSQHLPVISTRIFGYNRISDDIEKCFDVN